MNTKLGLALILIVTISFSAPIAVEVKASSSQSIPAPSVPEFTISFVNSSYITPVTTTQTTDPFTGQQTTHTSGGQFVENLSIDVIIKSEPYTPVTLPNGTVVQLYYTVQTKGHFEDWQPIDDPPSGYDGATVQASTTGNTIVNLSLNPGSLAIPVGGEEDFRVEAKAGYMTPSGVGIVLIGYVLETLTNSSWSSTQTITMPSSIPLSTSPSPASPPSSTPPAPTPSTSTSSPTVTPQKPTTGTQTKADAGVNWTQIAFVTAVVAIAGLAIAVVVLARRSYGKGEK